MNCETAQEKFSEYLDEQLAPEEAAALEGHLTECELCRREMEALRRTVEAVRDLPVVPAPARVSFRVMSRIRVGTGAPVEARPKIVTLWPRVLAVAAMFLVVIGITLVIERERFLGPAEGPRGAVAMNVQTDVAKGPDVYADMDAEVRRKGWDAGEDSSVYYGKAGEIRDRVASAPTDVEAEAGRRDLNDWKQTTDKLQAEEPAPAPTEPAKNRFAIAEKADGEQASSATAPEAGVSHGLAKSGSTTPQPALPAGPAAAPAVVGGQVAQAFERPRAELKEEAAAEADADMALLQRERQARGYLPVDQVLTVEADRPVEMARQAVELAARNGIEAVESEGLRDDRAGRSVELNLQVPADRYEDFLEQVSQIAPTQQQRLVTAVRASQNAFLNDVAFRLNQRQSGVAQQRVVALAKEANETSRAKSAEGLDAAPGAGGGGAADGGMVAGGALEARNATVPAKTSATLGFAADEAVQRAETEQLDAPAEVNLVIRFVAPEDGQPGRAADVQERDNAEPVTAPAEQ